MTVAGVYVIFGPQKRVYVGESGSIFGANGKRHRTSVAFARVMGLDWTIARYMPHSDKRARYEMEALIAKGYREAGYRVVSLTREEVTERAQSKIDYHTRAVALRASWDEHPERREAQAERIRRINASRTPESRSESVRKSWEKRRANPCEPGQSKRTLRQRRSELARRVGQ